MESSHAITILWTAASVTLGVIFGSLRSKIFSSKYNTKLHYYFYAFATVVFLMSLFFVLRFREDFFASDNWSWFGIIGFIAAAVSSAGLFFLTKKHLIFEEPVVVVVDPPPVKDTYTIDELNPIVNEWTSNADKHCIKLFGGDLNFFGETPLEMDSNIQYTHLKRMRFLETLILCEAPQERSTKVRYGKIVSDMPSTKLKFYKPPKVDLNVRGRIIKVQKVNTLLVYQKQSKGIYKAVRTDGGDSNGALYNDIWELGWELSEEPSVQDIEEFKKLFREG